MVVTVMMPVPPTCMVVTVITITIAAVVVVVVFIPVAIVVVVVGRRGGGEQAKSQHARERGSHEGRFHRDAFSLPSTHRRAGPSRRGFSNVNPTARTASNVAGIRAARA